MTFNLREEAEKSYQDNSSNYHHMIRESFSKLYPMWTSHVKTYYLYGFLSGYRNDYTAKSEMFEIGYRGDVEQFTFVPFLDGFTSGLMLQLETHAYIEAEITARVEKIKLENENETEDEEYNQFADLTEALNDAANGYLPECFTMMGAALREYVKHYENNERLWMFWLLQSMKGSIQIEIDKMNRCDD